MGKIPRPLMQELDIFRHGLAQFKRDSEFVETVKKNGEEPRIIYFVDYSILKNSIDPDGAWRFISHYHETSRLVKRETGEEDAIKTKISYLLEQLFFNYKDFCVVLPPHLQELDDLITYRQNRFKAKESNIIQQKASKEASEICENRSWWFQKNLDKLDSYYSIHDREKKLSFIVDVQKNLLQHAPNILRLHYDFEPEPAFRTARLIANIKSVETFQWNSIKLPETTINQLRTLQPDPDLEAGWKEAFPELTSGILNDVRALALMCQYNKIVNDAGVKNVRFVFLTSSPWLILASRRIAKRKANLGNDDLNEYAKYVQHPRFVVPFLTSEKDNCYLENESITKSFDQLSVQIHSLRNDLRNNANIDTPYVMTFLKRSWDDFERAVQVSTLGTDRRKPQRKDSFLDDLGDEFYDIIYKCIKSSPGKQFIDRLQYSVLTAFDVDRAMLIHGSELGKLEGHVLGSCHQETLLVRTSEWLPESERLSNYSYAIAFRRDALPEGFEPEDLGEQLVAFVKETIEEVGRGEFDPFKLYESILAWAFLHATLGKWSDVDHFTEKAIEIGKKFETQVFIPIHEAMLLRSIVLRQEALEKSKNPQRDSITLWARSIDNLISARNKEAEAKKHGAIVRENCAKIGWPRWWLSMAAASRQLANNNNLCMKIGRRIRPNHTQEASDEDQAHWNFNKLAIIADLPAIPKIYEKLGEIADNLNMSLPGEERSTPDLFLPTRARQFQLAYFYSEISEADIDFLSAKTLFEDLLGKYNKLLADQSWENRELSAGLRATVIIGKRLFSWPDKNFDREEIHKEAQKTFDEMSNKPRYKKNINLKTGKETLPVLCQLLRETIDGGGATLTRLSQSVTR